MTKTSIVYKAALWPLFEKYVTDPLFRFVPKDIPANFLTVFGNCCAIFGTICAWLSWKGIVQLWPLIPLMYFFYLVCDCWDGNQARRTNTPSIRGNFLDHFFDILIMGQIFLMDLFAWDISSPLFVALLFCSGYLCMVGTYYELYYNRIMYFESISAFEMMLAGIILACIGFATDSHIHAMLMPAAKIVIYASMLFAITSFMRPILRVRKAKKQRYLGLARLGLYIIALVLTSFFIVTALPFPLAALSLLLYAASYVERFFLQGLFEKEAPWPDLLFTVLIATLYFIDRNSVQLIAFTVFYQCAFILLLFVIGVSKCPGPQVADIQEEIEDPNNIADSLKLKLHAIRLFNHRR
ncbi:MAG: CDP-alcohol phosphatidyltransferase family protein [Spirochaetaceae bacterium]|jgi:phosphatidylglycerophosphate synthase|nr:CDP-alcohol phosphatidyltransferase family protein [Spirochaetaceae bacterium]